MIYKTFFCHTYSTLQTNVITLSMNICGRIRGICTTEKRNENIKRILKKGYQKNKQLKRTFPKAINKI